MNDTLILIILMAAYLATLAIALLSHLWLRLRVTAACAARRLAKIFGANR